MESIFWGIALGGNCLLCANLLHRPPPSQPHRTPPDLRMLTILPPATHTSQLTKVSYFLALSPLQNSIVIIKVKLPLTFTISTPTALKILLT